MANEGTRTTDFGQVAAADEILVNRNGNTALISTSDLAAQMVGSGLIPTDKVYAQTWTELRSLAGPFGAGNGAEVDESDTGSHVDPVNGANVKNAGSYTYSGGWRWIGPGAASTKVSKTTKVTTSGLASGGGDLTVDRQISVTAASATQARAGSANNVALTPATAKPALQGVFPGAGDDFDVSSEGPPGFAWGVKDATGLVPLGVLDDGTTVAAALEVSQLNGVDGETLATGVTVAAENLEVNDTPGFVAGFVDDDGRIALGIKPDGTTSTAALETKALNGAATENVIQGALSGSRYSGGMFAADIVFIPVGGQSNDEGSNGTLITALQESDNICFPSKPAGAAPSAFTPLTAQATSWSGRGEWTGIGTAGKLKALIAEENGLDVDDLRFQILAANDAWGGTTIAQRSKTGSWGYADIIMHAQAGYDLAQATGLTFKMLAIGVTDGETDAVNGTTGPAYKAQIKQYAEDLNADVKAITGQREDVIVFLAQCATNQAVGVMPIALAQRQAAEESDLIRLVGPYYQFVYYDNVGPHYVSAGARAFGALRGVAMKRVLVDGEDRKPLDIASATLQGRVVLAQFNVPAGRLVFDTTTVPHQANYGFSLVDGSGAALTISSVTIAGPRSVRIVAAAAIPTGAKLRYGMIAMTGRADPYVGGGGNLRDSQGDLIKDSGVPLHNWGCIFELAL